MDKRLDMENLLISIRNILTKGNGQKMYLLEQVNKNGILIFAMKAILMMELNKVAGSTFKKGIFSTMEYFKIP